MPKIVELRPNRNAELIERIKELVEEVDRGEFQGCVLVKLREDGSFATQQLGRCSRLMLAGALAFAQHDLMTAATPVEEGD